MKFSIKDFFNKCDQIHNLLRIWSHLLKKSFMENFIFVQWFSFHSTSMLSKYQHENAWILKPFELVLIWLLLTVKN